MPTTIAAPKKAPATEADFLPLEGTDYVEFYVGNAKQAAHFYKTAFGFQSLAYSGPETGTKDRVSYAIRQNKLTFLLTTPLRTDNPIADHIAKHGDGVKAIALKVKDATSAWNETTKRGGKSFMKPTTLKDDAGQLVMSGIHTYGEVCPEARDIIHLGATSCYVTDNTDLWLMREGLGQLRNRLAGVIDALARFAERYGALSEQAAAD